MKREVMFDRVASGSSAVGEPESDWTGAFARMKYKRNKLVVTCGAVAADKDVTKGKVQRFKPPITTGPGWMRKA